MTPGYHGCYLRVDLTTQRATSVPIEESVLRAFIGGGGLGAWILLQECPPGVDPFAADAPLLFVFSPLVGSPLTTSAKFSILAKSPLTQRINDSLSSSHFAIAGKKTGYDALCITGHSQDFTTLVITPEGVSFLSATHLKGASSEEAGRRIRSQLGNPFRVAAIGPGGENLVRFATISNDGRHAGRGGLGAVMGAKRLKAIAVSGDRLVDFAKPKELVAYSRELSKKSVGEATAKYRELGTVGNLLTFNRLGTLPTRNFQTTVFPEADFLAFEHSSRERIRSSCAACTIGCEHLFPRSEKDSVPVRMEYENLFALGPLCGVSDPEAVLVASGFCDEMGMDTVSAGVTIAFAMECAERGMIDAPGLRFGSPTALMKALEAISHRRGIGEILADGVRIASQRIGQGSEEFASHVKGLELPGYDPRALQTMALGFAVGTRGADHNRSGAYQVDFSEQVDRFHPGKASVQLAIATENEAAILDSLILCKFLRGALEDRFGEMACMLSLITGWDVSANELEETASRIISAKKLFNIRQGWTPDEDRLPERFFQSPIPEGASQGAILSREEFHQRIHLYNRQRGWTEDGYLPEEIVRRVESEK
ncbi:MAG: aldehyde ferredoxin oxidoreductase family protein [Planctomycetaceae bacterium]|nr:aldehyde ferredoxin oxidoreductase family protein [Planctomycetaceae bacterium]